MFQLYADKNQLTVRQREAVTSGSVNAFRVCFQFSEDWEGLERTAVFRCGDASASVLPDGEGECAVPWEVLTVPGQRLEAGVCGFRGGELVLPTIWASLGVVLEGASPGAEAGPPTPELWRQELDRKADALALEGQALSLLSGERVLSSVEVPGGDHRLLTHRDAEKQHPISAIDGLENQLKRIPAPVEPLTNDDLEEILK